MKTCKECGVEKEEHEFYSPPGRQPYKKCRTCTLQRISIWQSNNTEKVIATKAKHQKKKALYYAEKRETRRSMIKRATPAWANSFFMQEALRLARLRTKMFGFKWSVDHIVPIQSQIVCGLHVQNNLQVIPLRDNILKRSHMWPDMPGPN